ncbi:TPA: trp operon leader peptide [Escherichia coli]|nr:trp operon leader peptide [Escherichia coli]EHX1164819.1 trp operon leader peptide [Escherichia coli]KAE9807725.1 trp operon leader peptide [Escherichia coli]MBP2896205.1 trp operon leader peptide [Escherichia coli]MCG3979404.1 trp operon leader peptide [Escherichia coli]MEB6925917.1 trp operon leader peptide [Escherichia coli]
MKAIFVLKAWWRTY